MKFLNPMLVVTDMDKSVGFYKRVLGLEVALDFGANKTLTSGLVLQTADSYSEFIEGNPIRFGGNNAEMYFEEDNFDDFAERLSEAGVEYVHSVKEHSWGQRVVRFYDLDRHIIEVGENMTAVCKRFLASGMTPEQTAKRMDVPLSYVEDAMKQISGNNTKNDKEIEMYITKAEPNQIERIVDMSIRAFSTDVTVGGVKGDCPPDFDSVEWHNKMAQDGNLYQAMIGEELVGAAILFPDEIKHTLYVGRIFIDSVYHRKGYGILLMDSIEKNFPSVTEFNLDTPSWNKRTNAFYKKIGYRVLKVEDGFVFYQKKK